MEENNDIFVACGDALVYLPEPMHKKYSTTFLWNHPLSRHIPYDRFFNPLPLYTPVHIWDDPPLRPFPSIPPVAYFLNGWSISQPKSK